MAGRLGAPGMLAGKGRCTGLVRPLARHEIPVPAAGLGLVQRRVGRAQQGAQTQRRLGHVRAGDANAQRGADGCAIACLDADFARGFAQPLGHGAGRGAVGARQQHGKFLAAQAAYEFMRAQRLRQAGRDFLQHPVASGMAVAVVGVLEVVQVQHQHGARLVLALQALQRALSALQKAGACQQAGQRIVVHCMAQFAEHVLEGHERAGHGQRAYGQHGQAQAERERGLQFGTGRGEQYI